ncbi:MAG: hypothetical protein AB1609_03265 [Bacillota bacterium]
MDSRPLRRFVSVGFGAAAISLVLASLSAGATASLGLPASVLGLVAVIGVGVLFDIIGVAATAATEEGFHAMAADRVVGARQAIWIVRNADRVANFTNDVVGDAAGILSGAIGAALVAELAARQGASAQAWASAVMVALVSGLAVGGKAAFKSFAIRRANDVVFTIGRAVATLERLVGRSLLGASSVPRKRSSNGRRRSRVVRERMRPR